MQVIFAVKELPDVEVLLEELLDDGHAGVGQIHHVPLGDGRVRLAGRGLEQEGHHGLVLEVAFDGLVHDLDLHVGFLSAQGVFG